MDFDALIPNLPFILQYFDFLWSRRPIEIPHHRRFFVLLAILFTNQEVKWRHTATDIELVPCDEFLASCDDYVTILTHILPLDSENNG